jgi:DNA-binding MarR family transcriptional regulator
LSGRNEAKYETLKYLEEVEVATGSEIASFRNITHGCQSTLLKRYWKFGLLHRFSGEGKEKVYSLSERGHERLEWLEEQFKDMYFDLGPYKNLKRCRVKRNKKSFDFLKNLKKCRVIRTEDGHFEIERNQYS